MFIANIRILALELFYISTQKCQYLRTCSGQSVCPKDRKLKKTDVIYFYSDLVSIVLLKKVKGFRKQ